MDSPKRPAKGKFIFTEKIEGIGEPVSIMFFMPEEFKEREELVKQVVDNGGLVMDSINPKFNKEEIDKEKLSKIFPMRELYSQTLITESLEKEKFQNPDDYFLTLLSGKRKRRSKGKFYPWTLTEIIKLFQETQNCSYFDSIIMKSLSYALPLRSEAAIKTFAANHK